MKLISLIVFLLLWPYVALAATSMVDGPLDGFGNITFGMRKAKVDQILKEQITRTGIDHVEYETSVSGVPVSVTQFFRNRKAHKAVIEFAASDVLGRCRQDFNRALGMLKQSYGKPTSTLLGSRVEAIYEFSTGARIVLKLNNYKSRGSCKVLVSYVPAPLGEGLASF